MKKYAAITRWIKRWRGGAPEPQPQPRRRSILLTCFEDDQPLLLEDLNLGTTDDTAYDTVIVHRPVNTHTLSYLLPPLLDEKADVTWALLEGTLHDTHTIVFQTDGNRETLIPQAAHAKILDAEVYIGINLAVVPLSETHRAEIRTALLRLRERFGEKLHIRKLQASVLEDWPTQTRNTRNAIWEQIFA